MDLVKVRMRDRNRQREKQKARIGVRLRLGVCVCVCVFFCRTVCCVCVWSQFVLVRTQRCLAGSKSLVVGGRVSVGMPAACKCMCIAAEARGPPVCCRQLIKTEAAIQGGKRKEASAVLCL